MGAVDNVVTKALLAANAASIVLDPEGVIAGITRMNNEPRRESIFE